MTNKQKKKFESLCKQMAKLMEDMEPEHPNIQIYIHDGCPRLMDIPSYEDPGNEYVLASGAYWHRSGGGGF